MADRLTVNAAKRWPATLRARVDGLPAGDYLLIMAIDVAGIPGPFGARSDGVDRHDFGVDPRPRITFCP